MASEPLRKECNAEQALQVRLEMAWSECAQLQEWLTSLLQTETAELHQDLQPVLAKLCQATDQALHLIQCPVCQEWFAQGASGRSAVYCGPACKQKAYRQRVNVRKRQVPISKRRN